MIDDLADDEQLQVAMVIVTARHPGREADRRCGPPAQQGQGGLLRPGGGGVRPRRPGLGTGLNRVHHKGTKDTQRHHEDSSRVRTDGLRLCTLASALCALCATFVPCGEMPFPESTHDHGNRTASDPRRPQPRPRRRLHVPRPGQRQDRHRRTCSSSTSLQDIETLNRRALNGELEVTAVSIHAYSFLLDKYALLPTGCSMGDQYGPMVVARKPLDGRRPARRSRSPCRAR